MQFTILFIVLAVVNLAGASVGNKMVSTQRLVYALLDVSEHPELHTTFPPRDASGPLSVNASFSLIHLEKEPNCCSVSATIWLSLSWNDARLKWSPQYYDNITSVNLDSAAVWTPDVVPYDASRKVEQLFPAKVVASHTGALTYVPALRVTFPCDVTALECDVTWGSWTYNGQLLDLGAGDASGVVNMNNYDYDFSTPRLAEAPSVTRGVKAYTCCPEPYPYLRTRFQFKADPQWVTMTEYLHGHQPKK